MLVLEAPASAWVWRLQHLHGGRGSRHANKSRVQHDTNCMGLEAPASTSLAFSTTEAAWAWRLQLYMWLVAPASAWGWRHQNCYFRINSRHQHEGEGRGIKRHANLFTNLDLLGRFRQLCGCSPFLDEITPQNCYLMINPRKDADGELVRVGDHMIVHSTESGFLSVDTYLQ